MFSYLNDQTVSVPLPLKKKIRQSSLNRGYRLNNGRFIRYSSSNILFKLDSFISQKSMHTRAQLQTSTVTTKGLTSTPRRSARPDTRTKKRGYRAERMARMPSCSSLWRNRDTFPPAAEPPFVNSYARKPNPYTSVCATAKIRKKKKFYQKLRFGNGRLMV